MKKNPPTGRAAGFSLTIAREARRMGTATFPRLILVQVLDDINAF